ncbi:MAG: hypothetical protein CMP76_14990 [Flavobacterium sp.]|uniref:hypothetical protein n=1 Tax=Flavobacterium sp. TaxID=239 RepID=UPI000C61DF3D|nr:hypothetical protein [Flavobacterium sp.]MBF04587.1 hypothetical protein [Flavobacterium sp.]
MERRNFVKKMSAFTTGSLLLSGSNLYSFEKENEVERNSIDLSPLIFNDSEIILKGNFIDVETLETIQGVSMKTKVSKNRLFSFKETIESKNGSYEIKTGFSTVDKKVIEKVTVEITAEGYQTLSTQLYLSRLGCNIHCSIWDYNPNLKIEDTPKNSLHGNYTVSNFNFQLKRN